MTDPDKQRYRLDLAKDAKAVRSEFKAATALLGGEPSIWQVCERVAHARLWPLTGGKMDYYATEGTEPSPRKVIPAAQFTSARRVLRWTNNLKARGTAEQSGELLSHALEEDEKTSGTLTPAGLRYALAVIAWSAYVQDLYDKVHRFLKYG